MYTCFRELVLRCFLLPMVGVFIGLLFCESILRIAGISFPVFDTYDPLRGHALRPGKEGWYEKEGKAYLRINSRGYRDSEHDVAKPSGTFRIAVLGDSFSEARQVAQEDTFWSLLGRNLERGCPGLKGKKVEVLNFGVGGYGTSEALLTLRMDALRFSPDLVLLAFFPGNDLRENSKKLGARENWRMPRPYFVYSNGDLIFEKPRVSLVERLLAEGVHHFRLLELLNEFKRKRTINATPVIAVEAQNPDGIYSPSSDPVWQEAWLITERLLERISTETAAGGARFVLTIVPTPLQVHPGSALRKASQQKMGVENLFYADRRLEGIGQKLDFPVIRLAERLQRVATETGAYFHGFENAVMGNGHWNETGHRQAAGILVEEICTKRLAP